jgi:AraC-like DNA-binding protein
MAHWHHEAEIVLVESGTLRVGVDGEERILKAGEMAVAGSGSVHYYESGPGTVTSLLMFPAAAVGLGAWPELESGLDPFFAQGDRIRCGAEPCFDPADLFRKAYAEAIKGAGASDLVLRGTLCVFCGIAQSLSEEGRASEQTTPSAQEAPNAQTTPSAQEAQRTRKTAASRNKRTLVRIRAALEYIHAHFAKNIDLDSLARETNLSYFHFSRLLRDALGMPFKDYLNRLRVNEADRLLAESELSITQAALDSGFQSISAFHRAYKKIRGYPPGSRGCPRPQR